MLARKAMDWDVQKTTTYATPEVLQKPDYSIFELTKEAQKASIVIGILILGAFSLLMLNMLEVNYTNEIANMQSEAVQLSRDNDILNLEVSELKSPTRIQKLAQEKLGMVLPDGFVYNSRGTVVEQDVQPAKRIVD